MLLRYGSKPEKEPHTEGVLEVPSGEKAACHEPQRPAHACQGEAQTSLGHQDQEQGLQASVL